MTATDLYRSLKEESFSIRNDAGRLLVSPASKLSDEQRLAIKKHREDLLRLASDQESSFRKDCWALFDRAEFLVADIMHHCNANRDLGKLQAAVDALAAILPEGRGADPNWQWPRPE